MTLMLEWLAIGLLYASGFATTLAFQWHDPQREDNDGIVPMVIMSALWPVSFPVALIIHTITERRRRRRERDKESPDRIRVRAQ
jgi:hypothetical protein